MSTKTILVSACLLNIPCQYDGKIARLQLSAEEIANYDAILIPVCPEQLAGLSTPRKPVEIVNGDGRDVLKQHARVISEDGEDFTEQFIKGAQVTYNIAKITGATQMITQHRSPSCSANGIYNGTFKHNLIEGIGVCAALLMSKGIELIDIKTLID